MDVSAVLVLRLPAKNNSAGYSPKMLVDPLPRDDNLLVTLRCGVPGRWNSKKPTKKTPTTTRRCHHFKILHPFSIINDSMTIHFFFGFKTGGQNDGRFAAGPGVYSASFVRSWWKQRRKKDVERCYRIGGAKKEMHQKVKGFGRGYI